MRQVLQNEQIATLRKSINDLQLLEKIGYFKNRLTYPNKINKTFLLYISFKMKKLVSFSLIILILGMTKTEGNDECIASLCMGSTNTIK